MNVLAIIGSPREKGNTYKAVRLVEKEIKKSGNVNLEYLFLNEIDLKTCRGCFNCLRIGEDKCPLKDAQIEIDEKMKSSDGIIFASPTYVMNVSWLFKNFLDRFAYICHRPKLFNQSALVLTTVGSYGAKTTLEYMANAVTTWGCRSIRKLPLTVPPVGGKEEIIDQDIETLEKTSKQFYNDLVNKDTLSPKFSSLVQFRLQKAIFTKAGAKIDFPKDYEYYTSKISSNYYVTANVNPIKNAVAWIVEKFLMRKISG
jgi:NAD(P)H-dependent FMN reductase